MEKKEVIVDTCFLHKLSADGKNPDNIKKILQELEYIPVAHPYMAQHEFALHSYLQAMVDEGYIRVIPYEQFLEDDYTRTYYEQMFPIIHEDLRRALEVSGKKKRICPLQSKSSETIYNKHMSGSSMGDVHLIMMAAYLQLPIVLTQDNDLDVLRDIASRRMSLGPYRLQIYDGVDLINQIARNPLCAISKKELEMILNQMGERTHRSELTQSWYEGHPDNP